MNFKEQSVIIFLRQGGYVQKVCVVHVRVRYCTISVYVCVRFWTHERLRLLSNSIYLLHAASLVPLRVKFKKWFFCLRQKVLYGREVDSISLTLTQIIKSLDLVKSKTFYDLRRNERKFRNSKLFFKTVVAEKQLNWLTVLEWEWALWGLIVRDESCTYALCGTYHIPLGARSPRKHSEKNGAADVQILVPKEKFFIKTENFSFCTKKS